MAHFHVFSIPQDLVNTLTPRNLISIPSQSPKPPTPEPVAPAPSSTSRSCNICPGAAFLDLQEQRSHFRSDWHRYNVKVRLNGSNPVNESAFSQLIEALDDSLSGSESSSEEDNSNDSDAVSNLLNKSKPRRRSPSPDAETRTVPQSALSWFHSPPSTQIGVYKALFHDPKDVSTHLASLKGMQQRDENGRTWAVFMIAGGHFAGAIVRVSQPDVEDDDISTTKKKQKKAKPDIEVLRHKTFHRYTTRRKQGGSQSANDNAKGFAKSAGASLRRYGEQALRDDIHNLIREWADDIQDCERIWIRANTSNRKIFVNFDETIMNKGDDRLRSFPFPTRRPTQSELSRCLHELTRVKLTRLTEDELRAQDEAYLASLPKPKVKPVPAAQPEPEKSKSAKFSKEEEIYREKWSRLLEMINKGRLEPLKVFWEREGSSIGLVDSPIPEWTGERRGTLLQIAAQAGHENVTQWLLEDLRADPTIPIPTSTLGDADDEAEDVHGSDGYESDAPVSLPKGSRRTAYDFARSKPVRDVFRRCAAAHPDWWDWLGAARVPSVLSKEMEDEREEKKKVRRKGLKDRVKEREAKEREREKERAKERPAEPVVEVAPPAEQSVARAQRLGGSSGASDGIVGLTPEMRAKVERERRARAAEARLKALTSNR